MQHYVLMADVIDSRNTNQASTMQAFKAGVAQLNHFYSDKLLSPLTITLGDEFQGVVQDLPSAIALIVSMEEYWIHYRCTFKLRYALVFGSIDTPLNHSVAHGMMGDGLTAAREILSALKKAPTRFSVTLPNENQQLVLDDAFLIYQGMVDAWDVTNDYELVSAFLRNPDYKAVAESLGKDRALVWKREKTLNIRGYVALRNVITYLSQLS